MMSRIFKIARKYVVIGANKEDRDAYCSGCVLIKDMTVIVIAPSDFCGEAPEGGIFDRIELEAMVVDVHDSFCLLRMAFTQAVR